MKTFKQIDHTIEWRQEHEILRITPWGRDGLRVRAIKGAHIINHLDWALVEGPSSAAQIEIQEEKAVIRNGAIEAHISQHGYLYFCKANNGEVLLAEEFSQEQFPTLYPLNRDYKAVGGDLYKIEARFSAYEGERFYGLGQHRHGKLDQKGCVIDLVQRNAEVSIPFLISNRMYGFLWNNPSVGRVELGNTGTRWIAEGTRQLDYLITTGNSYAEIMENYVNWTGHAPMLPEWAAGFWQSKLRYRTQEEFLEVARKYKKCGFPLAVHVIDFFHWTAQGEWKFDPQDWPDPAAMVKELNDDGTKVMVSIWPTVNPNSIHADEMNRRGLLVRTDRGIAVLLQFIEAKCDGKVYVHYYDPFNPEARKFIWQKIKQNYYEKGIKVFWLDACEPEMNPMHLDNIRYFNGPAIEVGNLYPKMHQQAIYEGLRSEGEKDIICLSRSAWAGSQRYGVAVWSGDIESSFEMLKASICAGLNIMLSGIPWWTTDIGGFLGGNINDPQFRELVIRWFQYGVFCPLFRIHGYRQPKSDEKAIAGAENEIWSFGEEAYKIIKEILNLRERLRPYLMEQMRLAHLKGLPPMRPLFFDYPKDDLCFNIDDEFLLGSSILVAPIVKNGMREREVYLPDGNWYNLWTKEKNKGGKFITADAPLEQIPVYVHESHKDLFVV